MLREDWRKIKEKHGVPDGVCSFSIGERAADWRKKDEAASKTHDFKTKVVLIEALIKDMKVYEAALKKVKPAKFKGKTLAEQTKNMNDAIAAFQKELTNTEKLRAEHTRMAHPMGELQTQVKAAKAKLANIQKDDMNALVMFYQQQIRNDVGLPLKMVARANTDPKVKTAVEAYLKLADDLNDLCNTEGKSEPEKVWRGSQLALSGLAFAIGA